MQETIEKNIEQIEVRELFDITTRQLKESGILPRNYPNHKKNQPYELTRSALLAYKELHGVEYQLPENAIVIED